ncbi:MAG TPA: flagellar biosynthetic protein FliR [Oligoflexia bacterium]|nr:flagellar biosynthetic protein FliR [Oligoflexia bacterium]HMP27650.1 flagellar biosynthetic protein FliR [Oligoflexia bacterium]
MIFAVIFIRFFAFLVVLPLMPLFYRLFAAGGLASLATIAIASEPAIITQIQIGENFLAFLKSAMIGAVLALPIILVFELASSGGELLDLGRGAMPGSVYDPLSGAISPLAIFFKYGLLIALIGGGLVEVAFVVLKHSLLKIDLFDTMEPLRLFKFFSTTLSAGLIIILPTLIFFFTIDLLLVIFAKQLPGLGSHIESFFVKSISLLMALTVLLSTSWSGQLRDWLKKTLFLIADV